MNRISILDCTLRDGGYVNEWNFGKKAIGNIVNNLSNANIDIIECGFISDILYDDNLSIFNNTSIFKETFPITNNEVLYVGMIALGEKEIDYHKIEECSEKTFDGIRITFRKFDVDRAFVFAEDLMKKGYKVFMQPVGTMFYSDLELLTLIQKINALLPFAFYIVDTLGSMIEDDILRLFYLVDNNLKKEIKIGFHSHNNLQLSYSNAKALIKVNTERNIIIDSSVFGMGRGAGNLCTELIVEYLNDISEKKYDCIKLFSIIDDYLVHIKKSFEWGYSSAYYIAATKKCHPNYAGYLITKNTLKSDDIDKILTMIPKQTSYLYDGKLIEKIYIDYQSKKFDDAKTVECLGQCFKNKVVLLIAPGQSILSSKEQIQELINDKNIVSVSLNFGDIFKTEYIFTSNRKRFDDNKFITNCKHIITSNISTLEDAFVVDYSSLLNTNELTYDNAGLMAINFFEKLGAEKILLAGFDGFKSESYNHYDYLKSSIDSKKNVEQINKEINCQLNFMAKKIPLQLITDSLYRIKLDEE